jgi:hypothetical protein
MKISDITINQVFSNREAMVGGVDSTSRQTPETKKINRDIRARTAVSIDAVGKDASLNEQQSVNADVNNVARNIRVADQSMGKIEDLIQKMKDNLNGIVKQYPPFPPGSEERVRLLKNFNSFRKQIDQLTFPPKETGAMKIMADPEIVPEAGGWEVPVGEDGARITIRAKQVHTGPTGLDVGELPAGATDEEVVAFLGKLDEAAYKVEQRRGELSEDTLRIGHFEGTPSDGTQRSEFKDMPASAAEDKSLEVKAQFGEVPGGSVTGGNAEFIGMLR